MKIASALLVNVGTLTSDWTDGMMLAGACSTALCCLLWPNRQPADPGMCRIARAANAAKKPWVLDPVGKTILSQLHACCACDSQPLTACVSVQERVRLRTEAR